MFEVYQADLQGDEIAHRKFRLISEDVQGKHVLTNFHGMTLTTDRLKSLVKKWQVDSSLPSVSLVSSFLSFPLPSPAMSALLYSFLLSSCFHYLLLSSLSLCLPSLLLLPTPFHSSLTFSLLFFLYVFSPLLSSPSFSFPSFPSFSKPCGFIPVYIVLILVLELY